MNNLLVPVHNCIPCFLKSSYLASIFWFLVALFLPALNLLSVLCLEWNYILHRFSLTSAMCYFNLYSLLLVSLTYIIIFSQLFIFLFFIVLAISFTVHFNSFLSQYYLDFLRHYPHIFYAMSSFLCLRFTFFTVSIHPCLYSCVLHILIISILCYPFPVNIFFEASSTSLFLMTIKSYHAFLIL